MFSELLAEENHCRKMANNSVVRAKPWRIRGTGEGDDTGGRGLLVFFGEGMRDSRPEVKAEESQSSSLLRSCAERGGDRATRKLDGEMCNVRAIAVDQRVIFGNRHTAG